MKAIIVNDDYSLTIEEVATPVPEPKEILVKVQCAGVNRADLMQRRGFYPPPPGASEILGLECAGTVESVGRSCKRYQVGDTVCALLTGGGYAEYVTVDEGSVLPIPAGFSFEQAASLPEVFATAWLNLFDEGALKNNSSVLIHAGASGVGTAAIQLCRAYDSAACVTVGSQFKLKKCIELGAMNGSVRTATDFWDRLESFPGSPGYDIILDPVGGAYLGKNLSLLNPKGRLIIIGLMSGSKANVNLSQLLMKGIKIIGSTLRNKSLSEKASLMNRLEKEIWPRFATGELVPVVDAIYSFSQAQEAHELMESNETIGKIVLSKTTEGDFSRSDCS